MHVPEAVNEPDNPVPDNPEPVPEVRVPVQDQELDANSDGDAADDNEFEFHDDNESDNELFFSDGDNGDWGLDDQPHDSYPRNPRETNHAQSNGAVVISDSDSDNDFGHTNINPDDKNLGTPVPPAPSPPSPENLPGPARPAVPMPPPPMPPPAEHGGGRGRAQPRRQVVPGIRQSHGGSMWNLSTVWVGNISFIERLDQSVTCLGCFLSSL